MSKIANAINQPVIPAANNVYVSLNGSNTTGDGSFYNPYADVNQAMTSITTANPDNQFCIHVTSGAYSFANLNIKPNISINGDSAYNTFFTITNPITLDSSFSSNDSSQVFSNIGFANNVDFDLSSLGDTNAASLYLFNFSCLATFTFIGRTGTSADQIQVNNSSFSELNVSNTSLVGDSFTTDNNLSYSSSITPLFNAGFQLTNVVSYTTTSFSATSSNTIIGVVNGCLFYEAPSISGSALGLEYDVLSYGQFGFNTTSGSPTLLQMSLANGVKTNYSPTHFTATNPSVEGAIAGIDTALGVVLAGGITKVTQQVFTSTGTYTPTSGMVYADVEIAGGGGGGGGVAGAVTSGGAGGGGGGGGYARGIVSAATVGASKAVTIGAGGAGGAAGANNGVDGGGTSFGALIAANGGVGGVGVTAISSGNFFASGGDGGSSVGGSINIDGNDGGNGMGFITSALGGSGGGNPLAGTIQAVTTSGSGSGGGDGESYGGGGQGAWSANGTSYAGGAGASGVIIITEYCT